MSLLSLYAGLIVIVVVSLNVEQSNAIKIPSIHKIQKDASAVCKIVKNLPDATCDVVVEPIKTRILKYCKDAVHHLCGSSLPAAVKTVLPTNTCKEQLEKYVCSGTDMAIKFAKDQCIEELKKFVVIPGHSSDNICDGLPTVESMCTTVVNVMCQQLPIILRPAVPYCKKFLTQFVCEKKISV